MKKVYLFIPIVQKLSLKSEIYVEIINRPKILSGDKISDYKIEHTIKNISMIINILFTFNPLHLLEKE